MQCTSRLPGLTVHTMYIYACICNDMHIARNNTLFAGIRERLPIESLGCVLQATENPVSSLSLALRTALFSLGYLFDLFAYSVIYVFYLMLLTIFKDHFPFYFFPLAAPFSTPFVVI